MPAFFELLFLGRISSPFRSASFSPAVQQGIQSPALICISDFRGHLTLEDTNCFPPLPRNSLTGAAALQYLIYGLLV